MASPAASLPTTPIDDIPHPPIAEDQIAELDLTTRPLRLRARVRLSPAGILAVGGLVSGILLSTAALVWTSTSVARRHPLASRLRPR